MSGSRPTWSGADGRHRGLRRRDARESRAGLGTLASRGVGWGACFARRFKRSQVCYPLWNPHAQRSDSDFAPLSHPHVELSVQRGSRPVPSCRSPGVTFFHPNSDSSEPSLGLREGRRR